MGLYQAISSLHIDPIVASCGNIGLIVDHDSLGKLLILEDFLGDLPLVVVPAPEGRVVSSWHKDSHMLRVYWSKNDEVRMTMLVES